MSDSASLKNQAALARTSSTGADDKDKIVKGVVANAIMEEATSTGSPDALQRASTRTDDDLRTMPKAAAMGSTAALAGYPNTVLLGKKTNSSGEPKRVRNMQQESGSGRSAEEIEPSSLMVSDHFDILLDVVQTRAKDSPSPSCHEESRCDKRAATVEARAKEQLVLQAGQTQAEKTKHEEEGPPDRHQKGFRRPPPFALRANLVQELSTMDIIVKEAARANSEALDASPSTERDESQPGAYTGAPGEAPRRRDDIRFSIVGVQPAPRQGTNDTAQEQEITPWLSLLAHAGPEGSEEGTRQLQDGTDVEAQASSYPHHTDPSEQLLVEATLVEEAEHSRRGDLSTTQLGSSKLLVVAEAMDAHCTCSKRTILIFTVVVLLILGASSVAAACGVGVCSGEQDVEPHVGLTNLTATTVPSVVPSPVPSITPKILVINDLPLKTLEAMQDPDSPQSKAYTWVNKDPRLADYENQRRIQRFALATLYYSTGGENWRNNSGWLSYEQDECTWFSKPDPLEYPEKPDYLCNEEFELLYLTPWNNWQSGSIPPQVGLLTSLLIFDMAEGVLTGTIPTEFENLPLQILFLCGNALDGTIPTQGRYPQKWAI